jgi:isoleucyl-tRNA synthetase
VAETDYKSTLALPKTAFPMKANLPKREPETLKRWDEMDLYARLLETRKDNPTWILHDGPPYANGRVHLGTALNKILKDFVVRSRSMLGFRTPFVPGWDCHGMPIEYKVSRALGEQVRTMSKLELRKRCRAEAEKWLDLQRSDFRRLGCIGDWYHPYLTMAPEYDATEIAVLRTMVEGGYVYRGKRPVLWCFQDRTGLAEAEVEYEDHLSPSIYVAFALNRNLIDAASLASEPAESAELAAAHRNGRLFAVIWTTTPWTLPANLGLCLNETFEYVALKAGGSYYIVAARLVEAFEKECDLRVEKRIALRREALKALDGQDVFRHPFLARDVKLMYGEHVTGDAGTGLVHTAPGHGYEDFVIGAQYGLAPYTPVDDQGVFTKEAGEWQGRNVFEANDSIVAKLREVGALVAARKVSHKYPHCWRCHHPLIFRATEQWFLRIDHAELRGQVLRAIDSADWVPGWSRDRIRNMTETRPDWNLSRQRAWGVPIPALRCVQCDHVTLDLEVMKIVERIFAKDGSDAWFERPGADFVPPGFKCPNCASTSFEKQEDVLDVWFDSGCSQAAVLAKRPELRWPADAYLEAVEQARGWFGSSLACAVAVRGAAPFRSVINHGLTVDEAGRKMSKSLGNSEDAHEVANRVGADVIRLVYASIDYTSEMALGPTIFNAVADAYKKIRNTCRYLLGNLGDFDPSRDAVNHTEMLEFDRFILARLEHLKGEVRRAFESFDFQGAYHTLLNFIVVDLSSLYIDVARDRLYCSAHASRERRSAQTALSHLLDAIVRMLAPLIPYTAEEVYEHCPAREKESVHLLELQPAHPEWADAEITARWDKLLKIRDETLLELESRRREKVIGAPLEAQVYLRADEDLRAVLNRYREQLKELFIASGVHIRSRDGAVGRELADSQLKLDGVPIAGLQIEATRAPGIKCQRCWCYFDDGGHPELCPRCRLVVGANV